MREDTQKAIDAIIENLTEQVVRKISQGQIDAALLLNADSFGQDYYWKINDALGDNYICFKIAEEIRRAALTRIKKSCSL